MTGATQSHQQLENGGQEINHVIASDLVASAGSSKNRSQSGAKQRAVNHAQQHQNFLLTEPNQATLGKFSTEVPKILNSGKQTKAPLIPTNRYKNDSKQPNLNQTAPIQGINQNNMGQIEFQRTGSNSNNLRGSQQAQAYNQQQIVQSTPQLSKNKQDLQAEKIALNNSQQAPIGDRKRSFSSAANDKQIGFQNDQTVNKDGRSSSQLLKQSINNTNLTSSQFNSNTEMPVQSENTGVSQIRPSSRNRPTVIQQNSQIYNSRTQSKQTAPTQILNNLSLGQQNLHNYFETQMSTYQTSNTHNKPLPRKKRLQSGTENGTQDLPSEDLKADQGYSSQKIITNSAQNNGQTYGIIQTEPSPKRQPSLQGTSGPTNVQKQSQFQQKPKLSVQKQNRPQNPTLNENKNFQQGDIFLNVDPQYNQILYQLIQPNKDQFDFNGQVQYVMNASELTNQALAKLLYERNTAAAYMSQQHQKIKDRRSRNTDGLAKGAAGQSTSSFFNTKKMLNASSLHNANQGIAPLDPKIEKPMMLQNSSYIQGKTFFENLREEMSNCTNENIKMLMPDYQSAKYSAKRNGIVAAYGANTNQGIVRNYNEDRVAIILNIMKPKSKQYSNEDWPKCSFFGIYDGHGGHVCADFLRDYLHQFIIKDVNFPADPIKAIREGFKEAEKLFLEFAEGQQYEIGDIDRSGSCAIVALIIDDMCYIGNTGDSRAVLSVDGGKVVVGLSNDHKPTDDIEMDRILGNNGRIYQNASVVSVQQPNGTVQSQVVLGPHRVFPGRLSVCRTFGDIEAKLPKLEGNPRVVVADPDITAFKIDKNRHDFIVLGCDGIFDKLDNADTVHMPWQGCLAEELQHNQNQPLSEKHGEQGKLSKEQDERRHRLAGLAVDSVLKASAVRRSADNITAVTITFDNFYKALDEFKLKNSITSCDYDIMELQKMDPIPILTLQKQQDSKNVIYIENDDILEDASDLGADNQQEQQLKTKFAKRQNDSNASSAISGIESPKHTNGIVLGDTGDHHFPKSQVSSERLPVETDSHALNNADMLLSEIAEEDSISMISERNSGNNLKQKQNQKALHNEQQRQSSISLHSNFVNTAAKHSDQEQKLTAQHQILRQQIAQSQPIHNVYSTTDNESRDQYADRNQNMQQLTNQLKATKIQIKSSSRKEPNLTIMPTMQSVSQIQNEVKIQKPVTIQPQQMVQNTQQNQSKTLIQQSVSSSIVKPRESLPANESKDETPIFSSQGFIKKQRKSSNGNLRGSTYKTSSSIGLQLNAPVMPQVSSAQILPQTSLQQDFTQISNSISASNTQNVKHSSSQPPAESAKKSKTQQPGKLTEIFRSVDERSNSQVVQNQTQSFVQNGSSSAQNMIRALQLTSSMNAKNSNIQIKPISASRRRPTPIGNTQQNLNPSSNGLQQQMIQTQYQTNMPVPTIVTKNLQIQSSGKKSAHEKQDQAAKQTAKNNQLISQYLNQVNVGANKQQQLQRNETSQLMQTQLQNRQTRNGSNTKSPNGYGQLSRGQRVQMNYNLGPSKTVSIPPTQLQANLMQSSNSVLNGSSIQLRSQAQNALNMVSGQKINAYMTNQSDQQHYSQLISSQPSSSQIIRSVEVSQGKSRNGNAGSLPKFQTSSKGGPKEIYQTK